MTTPAFDLNADPEVVLLTAADALEAHMRAEAAIWPLDGCSFSIAPGTSMVDVTLADGRRATASGQILGGYSPLSARPGAVRFQWAWADPSVPQALAQAAGALRDYGQARGLAEFTTAGIHVEPRRLIRYAGLACALGYGTALLTGDTDGAQGVKALVLIGPLARV